MNICAPQWFDGQVFVLKMNELTAREYAATLDAQLPGLLGCGWTALTLMTHYYLDEMDHLRRIAPDIAPLLDKATIQSTKCRDVPRSYANL
jgi:hypothetical protein